nr:ABC transporter ATP-binding protein [uncultured Roseovarius sp.]
MSVATPLLSMKGGGVRFAQNAALPACEDISFDLHPGEILGIVGESGSGKSVTCRALMGMLPQTATVSGSMCFEGRQLDLSDKRATAQLRGPSLSMIFQDPMSALDPVMTVRSHLALRTKSDPIPILQQAGLADPEPLLESYAHRLSGGQCQRIAIACALAQNPKVLIADEPTTALDVTVQAGILRQLKRLASDRDMAIIFVTHDLGVVYQLCDRVLVMQQGRVVEQGWVQTVLTAPQHVYTKQMLAALPRPCSRGFRLGLSESDTPAQVTAPPRIQPNNPVLRFADVTVQYRRGNGEGFNAVDGVTLDLRQGEILGVVGESGSGKSTLAKTAVGLALPSQGKVLLNDKVLNWADAKMSWRRDVQYIFQDPRGALDPAARILRQVRQPLDIHRVGNSAEREARARALLAETRLEENLFDRKPGSLSGGQRQRATIARALALQPKVLICDESVSALDVTIQARVLNLLLDLREKFGVAILFISHDLSVIHQICDRVAVMRQGQLVEQGKTEPLFASPSHPYTQNLLSAVPRLPPPLETPAVAQAVYA